MEGYDFADLEAILEGRRLREREALRMVAWHVLHTAQWADGQAPSLEQLIGEVSLTDDPDAVYAEIEAEEDAAAEEAARGWLDRLNLDGDVQLAASALDDEVSP